MGLLFLATGVLLAALASAFPGALQSGEDWTRVAYLLGFLLLVAAGLTRMGPIGLRRHFGHGAIWAAIIAVLALGVAFRDELAAVPKRLMLAFSGGDPVAVGQHELAIPQNDEGAYVVIGEVNGQRVRFVVDTGATDTVLSPEDARRLGVDVGQLSFDGEAETANGVGRSALWRARRLQVGPIGFDGFEMSINRAPMSHSLLGMSFLKRLDSFEVRGRTLILRPRQTG
jgi:aspartyl protease family protein